MTFIRSLSICVFLIQCAFVQLAMAGDNVYFPPGAGSWAEVSVAEAGLNAEKLEQALRYAEEQKSSGMVILYQGRLVAERNWQISEYGSFSSMVAGKTDDGRFIEDVASVQKSVVSMLCGIAQGKGLLNLAASVQDYLGKGWSKAPDKAEQAITVRHLLTMTSGLTTALEFEQPAGTKFKYNTQAYSRLHRVLEVASGMKFDVLTKDWLTDPIGMNESRWVARKRAGGAGVNARGFATTARDLARMGVFVLANGQWDGKDVLGNSDYLQKALNPSQQLNRNYGFLWWLNTEKNAVPAAPADMVMAKGAGIRRVYVVPSLDLVVTRIGNIPEKDFDKKFWALLLGD
jgi:CubicO group peptidase (beta-lactamase class C family)